MVRPYVIVLARPQLVVRLADELPDREPLRAFALAGSAAQALDRPVFADRLIILLPRDTQILILVQRVEAGQDIRNFDSCGAALVHAVAAARAADGALALDDRRGLLEHIVLTVRQRLEIIQQDADISFHLLEFTMQVQHGGRK